MALANYTITRQGYSLLASLANTTGKTFKISGAICSDQPYPDGTDPEEQIALQHYKQKLIIVEAGERDAGSTQLRLRIDNKDIDDTFKLYQIGVYAKVYDGLVDPNPNDLGVLLQICEFAKDAPDVIPSRKEALGFVKDYLITTAMGIAENITINVDASAYVTMPRFLELVEQVNYLQSNENILVNPDGIVNQLYKRWIDTTNNLDFYYHKDMWYSMSIEGRAGAKFDMQTEYTPSFLAFISHAERGMQFKNTSDATGYFALGQIVDFNVHRRETLQNRYLTLSFKAGSTGLVNLKIKYIIDDEVIDSKDIILNAATCEDHSFTIFAPSFYNDDGSKKNNFRIEFEIGIEAGQSFYLANVKLERSNTATKYVMQSYASVLLECETKFHFQEITLGGLQKLYGVVYRSLVRYDTEMSSVPSAQIYENITFSEANEFSFTEDKKGFRYGNTDNSAPTIFMQDSYGLTIARRQCYVLIGSNISFKSLEYYLVVDCRPYL